jgi:hypothetical protein
MSFDVCSSCVFTLRLLIRKCGDISCSLCIRVRVSSHVVKPSQSLPARGQRGNIYALVELTTRDELKLSGRMTEACVRCLAAKGAAPTVSGSLVSGGRLIAGQFAIALRIATMFMWLS